MLIKQCSVWSCCWHSLVCFWSLSLQLFCQLCIGEHHCLCKTHILEYLPCSVFFKESEEENQSRKNYGYISCRRCLCESTPTVFVTQFFLSIQFGFAFYLQMHKMYYFLPSSSIDCGWDRRTRHTYKEMIAM